MFSFQPVENAFIGKTYRREAFIVEHFDKESFVTAYDIDLQNKISNARVVNRDDLIDALKTANHSNGLDILDPRILVSTPSTMVWTYKPSKYQPLYYRHNNRTFAKPILWCTFIFKYHQGRLSVCVAPNGKRPTVNTRVYCAPLPNVYQSGKICLGTCQLPTTGNIDEISEAYFNSTKTHMNSNGLFRKKKSLGNTDYYAWLQSKVETPIRVSELAVYGTLNNFIGNNK
ncbi:hypothetical protein [Vibrio sp. 1180_3]|uniref:hypothetical protein n=1 Tax=Vibrio sp. 1180_3 TaxID=2528832 RepID=UPI0024069DC8|nr:hypothetical protein [Vibrio sp. 1180_3]MDF9399070.1 hypothetical protein [Vibrio sp. 1180_3]